MLIAVPRTELSYTNICRRALVCGMPDRLEHAPWCINDCFHTAVKRDPDSGINFSPSEDSHFNRTRQAVQLAEL